jgi:hypothetical protein
VILLSILLLLVVVEEDKHKMVLTDMAVEVVLVD